MDKRRAIQIMTKAAQLYKEHLEDQKVLFLYGLPKEVKKQLQDKGKILSSVQEYEVAFHRYNFLHLTGVRLNKKETASAIHFYQKCLDKRLTENDFSFAKDGSTGQKLDILERMMLIKKNVTAQPTYKVFAVISKHYTDEKYTNLVKLDKCIDLKECCFSETIENMIDRENLS